MTYVILFVLTSLASAHGIRFAQVCGCRMRWLGALAYISALACAGAWAGASGARVPASSAWLGLAAGLTLGLTYLAFNAVIRKFGVGVAHLTRQLSIVAPIAASILVWMEPVPPRRALGLCLALAGVVLMGRPVERDSLRGRGLWWLLPFALLITAGATNTLFKTYTETERTAAVPSYLLFLFGGAAASTTLVAVLTEGCPGWRDLLFGLVLGLDNAAMNYFRVRAIGSDLGVKVFPTMALGVVLASLFLAMILWKERYRGRVLAGVLAALCALALINM